MITLADVEAAAARIKGAVLRSPFLRFDGLSRATGAEIYLKLDHLQATGAFKERGAANKIALLSPAEKKAGVIAMSAGNHAQAVARHAALAGIKATIVMPKFTPSTKVTRTRSPGVRRWCCMARCWRKPPPMRIIWPKPKAMSSSIPMTMSRSSPARARWRWRSCRISRIWMC